MSALPVSLACDLDQAPAEYPWLIEQIWGVEEAGVAGGEPKSCKSFTTMQMAVALTSGLPFLGRFAVPRRGRVLLFAAEDALHIVRARLDGICAHVGVTLDKLDLWIITAPTLRLDLPADCKKLESTVEELKPDMLILDPFVRLHRVDENVSSAVAPLLAQLRELQRKHHCAVVVVHHTRKGGALRAGQALRGSSEFHAWGDTNLYLSWHRKQLRLSIEHRAQPGHEGIPLVLDARPAHKSVALVVADDASGVQQEEQEKQEPTPAQRILAVLESAGQPLRMREIRESCRMRSATLVRLLADLVQSGVVVRSEQGWSLQPALPFPQAGGPMGSPGSGNGKQGS